jgi:hypothetical protein
MEQKKRAPLLEGSFCVSRSDDFDYCPATSALSWAALRPLTAFRMELERLFPV